MNDFEDLLNDRQAEKDRAIEALSEVANRLNDTIVSAFGEFADWDNHAGYDEIPEGMTIDPGVNHRSTLAQLWKLREDVNSVLAGMV